MPDTITIKTTGGDVHISPDPRSPVDDFAERIIGAICDEDRETDWLRFHVARGVATVYVPSITGLIAQRGGKVTGPKG